MEDSDRKYICCNCRNNMKKNKIPPLSIGNNMCLSTVPNELMDICSLEERLISLKIPFMKIISLPAGRQRAVHGAVVNVPSNIADVVSTLPRKPNESGIIPVKLKRRLMYKGHILYQNIRPNKIMEALRWLKK